MRKPIFAANWKMNKDISESLLFAHNFLTQIESTVEVDVVIIPPFTSLYEVKKVFSDSSIEIGAQNVYFEAKGPFTGEISPAMLASLGCRYAIVGHSERRNLFGERDSDVAAKAAALLRYDLSPIICIGESLPERKAGKTLEVVTRQLTEGLVEISLEQASDIVIAYEPIWAIGTGMTATPETVQEVHLTIRNHLHSTFGRAADTIRIQYGGSVKPENIDSLMRQPDVDGALVGGASLDPVSFAHIVQFGS